ncbi:MAG: hypothetical protein EXS00_05665 [Phycisphaerales bacterium]|nr:hypothetical protein [Phycisphaerales bacterium]
MTESPFQDNFRRQDTPRRVPHGVRLRRRAGMDDLPWPANAWFAAATVGFSASAREEGLQYAVQGQVATMTLHSGLCEAAVQGRAARRYRTTVSFVVWSREDWDRSLQAMAQEAVYAARLTTGEMPLSADRLFATLGLSLLPAGADDVKIECTCTERAPCKHAYAALAHAAERIEQEPLLLFTLRGMPGTRLLDRLQEARALATRGMSQAHPIPPAAAAAADLPPVEECLHDFWRPGNSLTDFEASAAQPHAPHALLRRLGPTSMGGKFPLAGILASAYDTIRAAALRVEEEASLKSADRSSPEDPK